MKRLLLICYIVVLTLISLSCTPQSTLEISVDETDIGVVIALFLSVHLRVSSNLN